MMIEWNEILLKYGVAFNERLLFIRTKDTELQGSLNYEQNLPQYSFQKLTSLLVIKSLQRLILQTPLSQSATPLSFSLGRTLVLWSRPHMFETLFLTFPPPRFAGLSLVTERVLFKACLSLGHPKSFLGSSPPS